MMLSKAMESVDLVDLTEELAIVDRVGTDGQTHQARRWEYAMALSAQAHWYDQSEARPQGPIIDVGGAGSLFWRMINSEVCRIVDPSETVSLAEHLRLGAGLASEVYCLSVIEHVDDLDQFLYHLRCLVAPGGLLFLTFDYMDTPGVLGWPVDTYHFHWMRKRIFNEWARGWLHRTFQRKEFETLGAIGGPGIPQVYDYSIASLALVKRV